MEFHLLPIFALVVLVGVKASPVPPAAELYWKTMLPNTPLPKSLQLLLQTAGKRSITLQGISPHANAKIIYVDEIGKLIKKDNFNSTIFFLSDDLHPGKRMRLIFTKSTINEASFLPHHIAKSTPFSVDKLPAILNQFSINPKSIQAKIVNATIQECEAPKAKGEVKYCATSLESLVDFAVSKLGHKAQVISNEVETENKVQEYTISMGMKKIGDKQIVCHKQEYPYAVFYCHMFSNTKAYMVPLVGADDGTKVRAAAICHIDTSDWNPKHLAFQLLKIKPGPPICHFLNNDALLWFST